jgi:pimeloyl-ACP methyl ester carboxylesterase
LDLWPLFEELASVPTLVLRGANSDLLTPAILEDMKRQKPDLVSAEIPHRGHPPFLDEQEAIKAIDLFLST